MVLRIQRNHVVIILLRLILDVEDLVPICETLELFLGSLTRQVTEHPVTLFDVLIVRGNQILMDVLLVRVDELP